MGSGDGSHCAVVDHPDRFLARLPDGGFEIEADGQPTIRAEISGEGWSIDEGKGIRGRILRRTASEAEGFVLSGTDGGSEAGRTMPLVGAGREAGLKFLLLDDGRLFRIVMHGPRRVGFDLLGWETPGAYLTAIPEAKGWKLAPTAACGGLTDLTALAILFAAEILDAEEAFPTEVK